MPITNLAPFIEEGWWTAPLISPTITRNSKGTKTFKAAKNWNDYKDVFNESPTPVGALMTGDKSRVTVLDCDSTSITELVLNTLPKDYPGISMSIGKIDKDNTPITSMSVYFSYSPDYPPTLNQGPMGMEWFNGGAARMVFLPTEGNKTKVPWERVPTLIMCPKPILDLITALSSPAPVSIAARVYEPTNSTNLNPIIVQELKNKGLSHSLFTIITPKSFKHIDKCLIPPNIPEGQRSNYMSRVSATIGSDTSVDKDLYIEFMEYLNELCPYPVPTAQLNQEIITPMVSGTAQIDNAPIWKYNKHWEKDRLTVVSKIGHNMEYFYDPLTKDMYELNHSRGLVGTFGAKDITGIVASMATKALPHQQYKFMGGLPNFEALMEPNKPFGVLGKHEYNIFLPTRFLELVNNSSLYIPTEQSTQAEEYFRQYMESLVPSLEDRTYLINHLYTKLTTFNYSAVVYYFVGIPGSGKGTFSRILARIIGKNYMSPNLGDNEIKEKYNDWLHNRYFVHFDEMHRSLNASELKQANEKIKRLSGGETFALRKMRNDSDPDVPMLATFIFTQNGSNMRFDENDRRYMWMDTPNIMSDELSEFFDDLTDEKLLGIAYYIATTGVVLSHKEYKKPPFSETKQLQMIDKMPIVSKIFYYIKEYDFLSLYYLMIENGIGEEVIMEGQSSNRIYLDTLISLVEAKYPTFNNAGDAINREAKASLPSQPSHPYTTTSGGTNRKYFVCKELDSFYPPVSIGEQEEVSI